MTPAGAERRALRPLWMLTTGAVIGAAASSASSVNLGPSLGLVVLGVGCLCGVSALALRRVWILWLVAGLALCFGRGLQYSVHTLELRQLMADSGQAAIRIEGRLDSGWEPTRWGWRAAIRLRSSWRGQRELDLVSRWRLEVRGAASPADLPDPGTTVACLATVRGDQGHPFLAVASPVLLEVVSPPAGVAKLRDRLARSLLRAAGTDHRRIRSAELAAALALGRRDLLTVERREGWRRSGMAHLLAVSGLHVGTVAATLWLVLAAANLHPRRLRWVLMAVLPAYAVLAGASPSAVRAALMGVVYLGGRQLGRAVIPMASVLLVTAGLLLSIPPLVADAGFQLTVLVTAALVRWVPSVSHGLPGPRWVTGIFAVPLVAQLAAAPIVAHHFRSSVPGAVLANLLVPALMAPALAVALLAAVVSPLWPWATAILLDAVGFLEALLWASGQPGRAVELVVPVTPAAVTAALIVAGWLALQSGRRAKAAAAAWVAVLIGTGLWWAVRPGVGGTRVHLLEVGDGLAATVSSPEGTVLMDAGRWRRQAAELLADGNFRRLAALAVSHADEDHFGGVEAVLRTTPVDLLMIPRWMLADPVTVPLLRAARRRSVAVMPVTRGQAVRVGGMTLEVLWPPVADLPADDNERALVIRARIGGRSVLMTSDIERATEDRLAGSGSLASEVLVVPHHGSRNSTTAAFLDSVGPRVALIPAGPLNRYNHPHRELLERLEARHIPFRYPKRDGACGARVVGDEWVLFP